MSLFINNKEIDCIVIKYEPQKVLDVYKIQYSSVQIIQLHHLINSN